MLFQEAANANETKKTSETLLAMDPKLQFGNSKINTLIVKQKNNSNSNVTVTSSSSSTSSKRESTEQQQMETGKHTSIH